MKKMEKWEIALQTFLKKWQNKKEVVGALVCGSYITGNPSRHSDIDIQIILDSKTSWRERGDEIIDGVLVSYFANPARTHRYYSEEDYKSRRIINAHMFCTGKILFDKTGELKQIIKDSKKYLAKKYPKQNKFQIESAKHAMWDTRDNLEEVFESGSEDFFFVFYNNLNEVFETYAKFLQFTSIPANKLKRFLVNERDKKKYHVANFPDQDFVKMLIRAFNMKDKTKMMKEYHALTNHVFKKMGGFSIDGWKLRSPAK